MSTHLDAGQLGELLVVAVGLAGRLVGAGRGEPRAAAVERVDPNLAADGARVADAALGLLGLLGVAALALLLLVLFPVLVEERHQTLLGRLERVGRHQAAHVQVHRVQFASLQRKSNPFTTIFCLQILTASPFQSKATISDVFSYHLVRSLRSYGVTKRKWNQFELESGGKIRTA